MRYRHEFLNVKMNEHDSTLNLIYQRIHWKVTDNQLHMFTFKKELNLTQTLLINNGRSIIEFQIQFTSFEFNQTGKTDQVFWLYVWYRLLEYLLLDSMYGELNCSVESLYHVTNSISNNFQAGGSNAFSMELFWRALTSQQSDAPRVAVREIQVRIPGTDSLILAIVILGLMKWEDVYSC